MSLNSLQNNMERRAASMAETAKHLSNPQDIQAMQQRLVTGIQNGSIKPYVGIPLIQELTQKLTEAKAQAAQTAMGGGMPQGQGAPSAPIAQQVMQQAEQSQAQGIPALPSNLPQSYAGGGIIAFEGGGEVERFQSGGSPAGRFFSGLKQQGAEYDEAANLRNQMRMKYGPASALPGLFMQQSDVERQAAQDISAALPTLNLEQLKLLSTQGPSALAGFSKPTAAAPLAGTAPTTAVAPPPAAPLAGATPTTAPVIGGGGFKPPDMQAYTPSIATLPERKMEPLTDLNAITKGLSEKKKTAINDAVKASQKELEEMDRPGEEAREEKFGKREAAQEKDSAMGRALNLMNLGFGIAGSKERTLAGALGNEGRQGIQTLIQGEAANRAAKNKLEDARDNFEQQKIAAKKGNYQAAQTAGERAGRDVQDATQMALAGAQAGNTQSISLYNTLQQGDIGRAGVLNQGEQLKAAAVDAANRNKLGIAQLAQQGAIAGQTLKMQERRFNAMDDANKARITQARAKGLSDFMAGEGGQLMARYAKEYGPDFLTAKDLRSQKAANMFNQRKQAYLADITGQAMDAVSAHNLSDL